VEIIKIILYNIMQLKEQFIIFGHWLIYRILQNIALVHTNIQGITKDRGCTY
jgi:hypothetical protein